MNLPPIESFNLDAALPGIVVATWACILLIIDLWVPRSRKETTAWLAAGGLVFAFVVNLFTFSADRDSFLGMFRADAMTGVLNLAALGTALISIVMSIDYLKRTGMEKGEYYVLILFTTAGAMFMASANDLIIVFVALEVLSIPLYVMAAFRAPDLKSEESGLKYFILGAFASAFFVYGAALVYAATGTTNLPALFSAVAGLTAADSTAVLLLLVGSGLMLVGLGFKVAVVPFHMWTPDVYEGAPTPVTAFMSVAAKLGGFGALLRIMVIGLPMFVLRDSDSAAAWQTVTWLIAAATLILGNFVAISQTNIKRMLAYSSIAHAGYVLMAVAAAATHGVAERATQAALVYLITYGFTNLGAFAIAMAVERDDGTGTSLDDFIGLARTRPVLALAMAIFMLSLTGVPGTAGFIGKALVFGATLEAGLIPLAIIGVLTSVASAFYYIRVVVNMYLREPDESQAAADPTPGVSPRLLWATYINLGGVLLLGIIPFLVTGLTDRVVLAMVAP
jgi:NADH-quinone oxidoreductase subunit N